MANNRLSLVKDRLDIKITIAKFYPGGWSCDGLVGKILNEASDKDTDYSMFGMNDWRIEFETVTDENGDPP
jgi:hypothetical protein